MAAGSTSMWTRFGSGSVQRAVPTSSSREPTTTTASASENRGGPFRTTGDDRRRRTSHRRRRSTRRRSRRSRRARPGGSPAPAARRDASARWTAGSGHDHDPAGSRRGAARPRRSSPGPAATRPGISTAGVSPVNGAPTMIGRHLDVGRSRSARHRAAQRLGDRRRDRLGRARPADVGGDRLERAALVGRLVEDAAAQAVERRVDLAGQQHDRRRVRPRLGERGERVERARAGRRRSGRRADPGPARSRPPRTRHPARDGSGCAGWTASPASAS